MSTEPDSGGLRPPVVARWLLRALLPGVLRDTIDGDLEEGFRQRTLRTGRRAAWRWYWSEVMRVPYTSLRHRAARLDHGPGRRRDGSMSQRTGGVAMADWTKELRIAARSLARRPAFALTGVLTLALSLGAATLLFSVAEGVLLRPLPFPGSDRIVTLYLKSDEWRTSDNPLFRSLWDWHHASTDHVDAWRENPVGLESVGSFALTRQPITAGDHSLEGAYGLNVDPGFFATVGLPPSLGRLPTPDEFASGTPVALISESIWADLFDRDADVLGRTFGFGDDLYTVVGVLPSNFPFPNALWAMWTPHTDETRGFVGGAIGRLNPGVSVAEASASLDRVARRLGEGNPELAQFGARAVLLLDDIVRGIRTHLLFLLFTALAVLGVACVNLANLILVRGTARRGELAVRTALGASKRSLFTSVFSEVLVVFAVGGALGVGLAYLALDPFVAGLASTVRGLPREGEIALNGTVLLFSAAATLASALLAGLVPALRSTVASPAAALAEAHRGAGAGRAGRRAQRALLFTQCALTAVLLIGTGLLVRSAVRSALLDVGFDARGVVHLSLRLDRTDEVDDAVRSAELESVRARLAALPGVSGAALASTLPVVGGAMVDDMRTSPSEDAPAQSLVASTVSSGYFGLLAIPVLAGALPAHTAADGSAAVPVALSESAARALFGVETPIGRTLYSGTGAESEVVAVVADSRFWAEREPFTQIYRLGDFRRPRHVSYAVRVAGDPNQVLAAARAVAAEGITGATVLEAGDLEQALSDSTAHLRARAMLMVTLGALAALLTMVGIGGVVSHFLSEQTREVAVRMAIGAAAGGETRRVTAIIVAPALGGVAAGVLAAFWLSRLAEDVLFEVSARDPASYAAAAALVLLLAAIAAWIPARRTARIEPAQVLNSG